MSDTKENLPGPCDLGAVESFIRSAIVDNCEEQNSAVDSLCWALQELVTEVKNLRGRLEALEQKK